MCGGEGTRARLSPREIAGSLQPVHADGASIFLGENSTVVPGFVGFMSTSKAARETEIAAGKWQVGGTMRIDVERQYLTGKSNRCISYFIPVFRIDPRRRGNFTCKQFICFFLLSIFGLMDNYLSLRARYIQVMRTMRRLQVAKFQRVRPRYFSSFSKILNISTNGTPISAYVDPIEM